ncbi:hypothetical protein [Flindersiella endophytica]
MGGDLAPARTMKGSALLGKLHAFRQRLETGELPGVVENFVTSLSGTISTARRLRI